METRPPTITRILIAAGFALSCFALALFLWIAFGGPLPLKPESYRIQVPVTEATQLAKESDVRISGVSVGKVKTIALSDDGGALATIELQARYAPIPIDTKATLRQKTLLGETYVELSPGSNEAETLEEGGALDAAQITPSVQLDEIFRTFDSRTRAALRTWMQGAAASLEGRGKDLSIAIASLDSFAQEADQALRILDSQEAAVTELVGGGADVFEALSERQGQLSGLIRNTQAVFSTTARRNDSLQDFFTVFPTFLQESRLTLTRLDEFAANADPVITQLRPSARELGPTLDATADLSTELLGFWPGLRDAIDAAPKGFAALRRLLDDDLPPLLTRLDPFMDEFTPILAGIRQYRHEITGFLGNATSVLNATNDEGSGVRNYIRTLAPFSPEMLAAFSDRLSSSRSNPYIKPGGYEKVVKGGLESFQTYQCNGGGVNAILDTTAASNPNFNERVEGDVTEAQALLDRIKQYVFVDQPDSNSVPQPACKKQAPYGSVGGAFEEFTDYMHVRALED